MIISDLFTKIYKDKGPLGKWASIAEGYFVFPKLEGQISNRMKFQGKDVITWSINDYLGLANHPEVRKVDAEAASEYGSAYPMGARMMSGHTSLHEQLQDELADFVSKESTYLLNFGYQGIMSTIDALVGKDDVIVYDVDAHACIIDGVRLCKASRYRYDNNNMEDLEIQLIEASKKNHRFKIIVTDGVFSMDGIVAKLDEICDLADKYDALVMIDECHATGFIGATGRGTLELKNVLGRIDIITGTLGKALGGAMGGYTTGKKEIIEVLRQRSRPYLFSNSLAPAIVGASLKVFEIISNDTSLRDKLEWNTNYFRAKMGDAGFDLVGADAAIVPVMLYDAKLSQVMANKLLEEGIYVIGFFFPVVPKGKARIRVQLSAAHSKEHLDKAIASFIKIGRQLQVI